MVDIPGLDPRERCCCAVGGWVSSAVCSVVASGAAGFAATSTSALPGEDPLRSAGSSLDAQPGLRALLVFFRFAAALVLSVLLAAMPRASVLATFPALGMLRADSLGGVSPLLPLFRPTRAFRLDNGVFVAALLPVALPLSALLPTVNTAAPQPPPCAPALFKKENADPRAD